MFFNSMADLVRVVIVGTLAYVSLIVLLRISGKHTLSKMNAFDLVVTVALGSTLATVLLSKDVALMEGIVGFLVLIALQYGVAWTSVRAAWARKLVKSEPSLLFYRGVFLDTAMRHERVARDEVRAAVRSQGIAEMQQVGAVVLETDGSFSVIRAADSNASALDGVVNWPPNSNTIPSD